MMDEREPQWYEQARKGPFQEARFTDSSAERVMRRLRAEAEPAPPRSRRMPRVAVMAALILLLLAGAFYLKNGPLGRETPAGVKAPVEEQVKPTDEALKKTAERLMLEQLGQQLPFEKLDRIKMPGQAELIYRENELSDSYAFIWIDAETGEAAAFSMSASVEADDIDKTLINEAGDKLQKLGYTGEFQATGITRYVSYGRTADKTVQVINVVHAAGADINFTNGVYVRASFNVNQKQVSEELKQAGLEALGMLRFSSLADQLTRVVRSTTEGAGDEITLYYGDGRGGDTFVTFDYATRAILDVADYALNLVDLGDSRNDEERGEQLLNMDDAILQSTAAAIADKLYGIRLVEDYMIVKNGSMPGKVTFESRSGAPAIEVSYNLDGVMYSFSVKRETNSL
ncbi:hypothetical protein [Paenibacillus camerounensis]|uniref:hypothetical protein n=1 Tax=Paenibacillus camerounensis TaxID=1243663 RepID=UPI000AF80E37|nr:hypothetical protein [Paenibacillus camerounensis]